MQALRFLEKPNPPNPTQGVWNNCLSKKAYWTRLRLAVNPSGGGEGKVIIFNPVTKSWNYIT